MYQDFYQMKSEAFINQPLPEVFFNSSPHKKAWDYLVHGINTREQFLLLCGDYGVGKTTLCIRLIQALKEVDKIPFLFISTPTLCYESLLARIAERLHISVSQEDVSTIQNKIYRYFEENPVNRELILIIDDVQDLDISTLNQLRLFANFNIEGFFPIRLLLFSNFSFIEKLKIDIMHPLNQRIRRRYYLQRLNFDETREYIYFRLVRAGAPGIPGFQDEAIQRIFDYSNGAPRSINNICDCCLLVGAGHGLNLIDDSVVSEAIKYFDGNGPTANECIVSSRENAVPGFSTGNPAGNNQSDAQMIRSLSEELKKAQSALKSVDSKRTDAEAGFIRVKKESANRIAELNRKIEALTDELDAAISLAEQLTRERSEIEEKISTLSEDAGKVEELKAKIDLLKEELKKMAAIAETAIDEKVSLEEKLHKLQQNWEKYVAS